MNIRQLKAICEVVKQGLRMSTAAAALYKSQPGISRQIKEIECELGVRVFRRKKNKIESLTPAGREVIRVAERILRDFESLRLIGREYSRDDVGELAIATTHTHARYLLPKVIEPFSQRFPNVSITLRQATAIQCLEVVATGDADIAISTAASPLSIDVTSIPAYQLTRCVIARHDHPIIAERDLTLEKLAMHPIIAIDASFGGWRVVNDAFSRAGLKPHITLTAVDADIAKTYIEKGMGISVLANIVFDPIKDRALSMVDASTLFESTTVNVSLRRHSYLRSYIFTFLALFAPHIPRELFEHALEGVDIDFAQLAASAPPAQ